MDVNDQVTRFRHATAAQNALENLPLPTSSFSPLLTVLPSPNQYSPAIQELLSSLYYRQSMIKDFLTCPQLMLYKWILQFPEEDSFFAAICGTAGHECIREMHETRNFDFTYIELTQLFHDCFDRAVKSSAVPPRIGQQYKTLKQQLNAISSDYVTLLEGYQKNKRNRTFKATVIEQKFALTLTDEFQRNYIFTGQIDQAGFYDNAQFSLRDVKFRMNQFKPGKTELKLDLQLSLYAYAIMKGSPSCPDCEPRYSVAGQLLYEGPCKTCKAKLGTSAWPQLVPETCEIIWMRDYEKRKKHQYAKFLTSDTEKELNPATGRQVKKKVLNPEWIKGYKVGDYVGPGYLESSRSAAFLAVHIQDVLRMAGMIRDGRFYRKAGEHCNFWCKFQKPCLEMFESKVQEIDTSRINEYMATVDPFGGD